MTRRSTVGKRATNITREVFRAMAIVVIALITSSCNGSPTSPTPISDPLKLSVSLSQPVLQVGSGGRFIIRLENTGSENLTLHFPSDCQIRPYIVEQRSSAVVFPMEGEWPCVSDVTNMHLPAYSAATREVSIIAMPQSIIPPRAVIVALGPGEYSAYAVVEDSQHRIKSATIRFAVETP